MLEKTEGAIKNEQSRDTGNIGYTIKTQDEDKQNNKNMKQHRKLKKRPIQTQKRKTRRGNGCGGCVVNLSGRGG